MLSVRPAICSVLVVSWCLILLPIHAVGAFSPTVHSPPCSHALNTDIGTFRHLRRLSATGKQNEADSSTITADVRYRPGNPSDFFLITKTLASELMNPLGIRPDRFIVAISSASGGGGRGSTSDSSTSRGKEDTVVGWGQIKPLGPKISNPKSYTSRPGSGSIDSNVDEDLWLEFESSSIEFPNGLKTLPWTEEYRAAMDAARVRREKRDVMLSKERMDSGQLWELASVYVLPEYRGLDVGSGIVQRLLEQHDQMGRDRGDVYALTLRKTVPWYDGLGFEVVESQEDVPQQLVGEIALGKVITGLLGEELVCIRA